MSRIKNTFNRLKKKDETALIPYIMAGDPDLGATKTLILEMEKAGCDIIELGAPFSDPLADGPTIQQAAIRSLRNGTTVSDVLRLVVQEPHQGRAHVPAAQEPHPHHTVLHRARIHLAITTSSS